MKPIYLAGLASTVVTLLSASESRGYRALRYGWLTGWMLTVVATVVGIVWFYLGYTDETNNPFLFHYGSLQKGPYPRIRSTFLNANLYCNYLVVTSGWLRSPKARFALICSALPTLSPALGPLLLVCLWQTSRPRVKAIGILASAAIYLATWTFPSELLSGKFRWSGRVQCWEAAANEWLRAPVFGLGPGQAQVLVEWKNPEGLSGLLTDPHNLVLSVLSQGGLITLLSLFALTWWLSKSSQLDLRRALLGAVWLDGLTGSYEDARHIWVAVGALAAFNPWRKGGSFKDPGPPA